MEPGTRLETVRRWAAREAKGASMCSSCRSETGPLEEHPWVLVVGDRNASQSPGARWRARGWEVYRCEGPASEASCPLLADRECPVAAQAHLVVDALGEGTEPSASLRSELAARHPGLPVVGLGAPVRS